jgi:hypothetical protein
MKCNQFLIISTLNGQAQQAQSIFFKKISCFLVELRTKKEHSVRTKENFHAFVLTRKIKQCIVLSLKCDVTRMTQKILEKFIFNYQNVKLNFKAIEKI